MRYCIECGTELAADKKFCTECGAAVMALRQQIPAMENPAYTPGPMTAPDLAPLGEPAWIHPQTAVPPDDSPYGVVGLGSFLGMLLLMMIPAVNLILLIVWAVSAKKLSQRNFARAALIVMGIGAVATVVMTLLGATVLQNLLGQLAAGF